MSKILFFNGFLFFMLSISFFVTASASAKNSKKLETTHIVLVQTPEVSADIVDLQNKAVGRVSVWQTKNGLLVRITLSGITAGMHGIAFHDSAICKSQEKFASAGGHIFKDESAAHGILQPQGGHAGDLPNLIANENGNVDVEFLVARLKMYGRNRAEELPSILDYNGSSLIIYKNKDDYVSQPNGGAGARVACAALRKDKNDVVGFRY